jgi:GNAT superfamily N-acetyltransferase
MYQYLGKVTLKSGEVVEAGLVTGPDLAWASKVETLLGHKGPLWQWQNRSCLTRQDLGIEVRFYLLHRGGEPFCNILTCEVGGVGLFGHVYTRPEDRRQHASSLLLDLLLADFAHRGGRALYLGTGFDSPPWHIYHRVGFRPLSAGSGTMVLVRPGGETALGDFEASYFGKTDDAVTIEPLGWRHWPTSSPLFCSVLAGHQGPPATVRLPVGHLLGRALTEGPLLHLINANEVAVQEKRPIASVALRHQRSQALLGMATWQSGSLWPNTIQVDLFCHAAYWGQAAALLAALHLPTSVPALAWADSDGGSAGAAKRAALSAAGFQAVATLPGLVVTGPDDQRVAVTQFYRG